MHQSLKKKLEVIQLQIIPGENVKLFKSQFLQTCLDLLKNVPSNAPFTLNEQLSSSLVEQFQDGRGSHEFMVF